MNRLVTGVAIASIALATTISGAAAEPHPPKPKPKPSPRAYVFRATLQPASVGPYALLPGVRGQAQLVDGKKNNKISIHVRGVLPGATYTWHIHRQVVCVTAPCPPLDVPGWTYGTLKANGSGEANAKGTSSTFEAQPGATYLVDVHVSSGEVLAQGVLKANGPEGNQP